MKKGKLIGRIFAITLAFVMVGAMLGGLPALVSKVEASPATIYVPDNYPTIQAAVDAASPGDTIIVYPGTYIIENTLTILQDINLTLKPGVVIRFKDGYSGVIVQGTLKAIGTEDEKIVFTSYRDDEYGGSGNPAPGDWKQIYFSPTSVNSELINVIVKYGGSFPSYEVPCHYLMAAIRVDQSSITLKDSIIEQNRGKGVYLINSSSIIDNVQFFNNTPCQGYFGQYGGTGISIEGGSPTVENSTFRGNVFGIEIRSGASGNSCIYLSNFIDNGDNVYSYDSINTWNSPEEITYTYNGDTCTNYLGNYWDDYTGSDGDGDGIGDTPYTINSDKDNYPLVEPFENYIPSENQPPVASFTYSPENPLVSEEITFDSSDSYDPDGEIVSYDWDFGDGDTASAQVVTHTYSSAGDYTVTLTVTDNGGATDSTSKVVNVKEFGTEVGEYNGILAYSNGYNDYVSYEYNYVDGYNTGMKWQCVEYVNRYYYIIYGMEIRIPGTNAEDYYGTASDRGLIAYPNGGATSPQPGDILCSNGGDLGHVAIVREVTDDSIHVIHQNWANTEADNDKPINISVSDGHYTVSAFSPTYPVQGWLRKENQPPVADAGTDQSVSSGDLVFFDGSNSYDPDGTIVNYGWDFRDGETATGCHASHRFRGTMNESKTYTVTLTVEDNSGATAADSCDISVTPLEKMIEVTHEPAIPIPGQPVSARMTVSYNWIHDDTYVVSRIHYQSGGFIGVGAISIWDFHSHVVPMPKWAADIFCFGGEREETYSPILEEIHYGGDVFQGIEVDAFDAMNVYITGWAGISISIGPSLPVPFFETNSACFQPDYTEAPDVPIEAPSFDLAHLCSPGELSVYDPEGRVTGLVNGEIKEEIPYSAYNDNTVIILSLSDSCRYEVVGTDEGSYGLGVASVEDGETTAFTATDIPTVSGAVHQYIIDWEALSEGEEGVTVQVDSDGDGEFEDTFTSDGELTHDEFTLQTETVIDFDPDTLNLRSREKFVTVYIELPPGYDVSQIDISSIKLNGTVSALAKPTQVGDYDSDAIPDLMVKFDAAAVKALLKPGNQVELTVTGEVAGIAFEGSDTIRVISR